MFVVILNILIMALIIFYSEELIKEESSPIMTIQVSSYAKKLKTFKYILF